MEDPDDTGRCRFDWCSCAKTMVAMQANDFAYHKNEM